MTTRASVLAAVLIAVSSAGCGHARPEVSERASSALTADVTRLQAAAARGTASEIAKAADALRAEVATQRAAGGLSTERAAAVLDQLARVLADTAATPRSTPPTPTPSPTSDKGRDKGEDKDKGGDGEGD